MKRPIDIKRVRLFLLMGAGFLFACLLYEVINSPGTFSYRAPNHIWFIIYATVLNYIFLEYSMPYVFKSWKRLPVAIPILFVHMMLYSFGLQAWRSLGVEMHIYTVWRIYKSNEQSLSAMMAYSMGTLCFFGIIRHIYDYQKLRQATQQLRLEKQEAELNFLKSQTNPHFLFNTLNNIYSLARDKSDLAPESVLRLSKILRFMLYETGGAFIAIEQELQIIADYIALERLRYDDSLRIRFTQDIEDMRQAVPPLLLMPLVENAFKHGVSETRGEPFIEIHLSVKDRQLNFTVKNSAEDAQTTVKENIGLSNLRRQLELLYRDYYLSVQQAGTVFTAVLKINLASHV